MSADHRHSSHNIHRPLSKLPSEGRRKKSSKKRRKDKDQKTSHVAPSSPVEEGEDEEEEEEEVTDVPPSPSEAERPRYVEVIVEYKKKCMSFWFISKFLTPSLHLSTVKEVLRVVVTENTQNLTVWFPLYKEMVIKVNLCLHEKCFNHWISVFSAVLSFR